jgi:hypothetical protein
MNMRARVHSIDEVRLSLFTADDLHAAVIAIGKVGSLGWSDPVLVPFAYVSVPTDGILELDFCAMSPLRTDARLVAPAPISASVCIPVPPWVKGVRVHASKNFAESGDGVEKVPATKARTQDWIPWPW